MKNSKEEILATTRALFKNTLMETLEIEITDFTEDSVSARMPVNSKVHQPDGVLHGGATVALAETLGSFAAIHFMSAEKVSVRGIEISANHVKSVRHGYVYATARPLHMGRTIQLWQIRIENEKNELVALVKLTTIALKR